MGYISQEGRPLFLLDDKGGFKNKLPVFSKCDDYITYIVDAGYHPQLNFCETEHKHILTLDEGLDGPAGCHYDAASGYIYIADSENYRIVRSKIDGSDWDYFGSHGSGVGQFGSYYGNGPYDIYYDAASEFLYIADLTNSRIVKTKWNSVDWESLYPPSGSGLNPRGIYYDAGSDYIYFANYARNEIGKSKIDGTGWTILKHADYNFHPFHWTSRFETPMSIWYNAGSGLIYVADSLNERIIRCSIDGITWDQFDTWGNIVGVTKGIIYDAATGFMYISNNNKVTKVQWNGAGLVNLVGFSSPQDLDVDIVTGYLYVPDQVNDYVIKTKIDGSNWEELS